MPDTDTRIVTLETLAAAQEWLDQQPQYNPGLRNMTGERQRWQREHEAWMQHGPTHVRRILAALPPAPALDVERITRVARDAVHLSWPNGTMHTISGCDVIQDAVEAAIAREYAALGEER